MPATIELIDRYQDLARTHRALANIAERFGVVQHAERLRDDAALYERTAAWVQKQNKLESGK